MCVCTKVQSLLVIYGCMFALLVPVDMAVFIIYQLYQTHVKMIIFLIHQGSVLSSQKPPNDNSVSKNGPFLIEYGKQGHPSQDDPL